eukprot:NODE_980_length_2665_cov_6.211584.p14 GENE.NODE_980_length_2665_cov_6.211584~~NODE_980_length_2665_cov_6.211584.p14  ORF type:complete len:54 (-),score=3.10 NODE_980_length_2665_cov_6.211584:795-956(-)
MRYITATGVTDRQVQCIPEHLKESLMPHRRAHHRENKEQFSDGSEKEHDHDAA